MSAPLLGVADHALQDGGGVRIAAAVDIIGDDDRPRAIPPFDLFHDIAAALIWLT